MVVGTEASRGPPCVQHAGCEWNTVVQKPPRDPVVLHARGTMRWQLYPESRSSQVQYDYKTHSYGRRHSSAIGVQRCSNLIRSMVLPAGTQHFDMVNAMTNLVVQAMNKLELPTWLPMRELRHWRHYAEHTAGMREQMQAQIGVSAKRVILSVAHGSAIPEVDDVERTRWLNGLSVESRLLRWVAFSTCTNSSSMRTEAGRKIPPLPIGGRPWRIGSCAASKTWCLHLLPVIYRCILTASWSTETINWSVPQRIF